MSGEFVDVGPSNLRDAIIKNIVREQDTVTVFVEATIYEKSRAEFRLTFLCGGA